MTHIKDVAQRAGVSIATVSNVLRNKGNVGDETRERILLLCEELGYHAHAEKWRGDSERRTILFIFSDFDRSFYLKIIEGMNDYVERNDYDLIICASRSCEKYLNKHFADGCISLDANIKDETLLSVAREHYPVVVLDRVLNIPYIKPIVVSNYEPMTALTQGLIDRGYRKFAFIGGIDTDDTRERYRAFSETLEKNGVSFPRQNYFSGDFREKSGHQAARIMTLSAELPEILVCANDNMAIGAIRAFTEHGLRVPDDIAVTGFDDSELAEAMGLTTISIPNYERGYIAARSLIENIHGQQNYEPMKVAATVKWRVTTKK